MKPLLIGMGLTLVVLSFFPTPNIPRVVDFLAMLYGVFMCILWGYDMGRGLR